MSESSRKQVDEESAPPEPTDNQLREFQVYPTWIVYSVFSIMVGLGLIVTQSLMLKAREKRSCDGFRTIGGIFLAIGIVQFLTGFLTMRYRAFQLSQRVAESTGSKVGRYIFMSIMVLVYAICVAAMVLGSAVWSMHQSLPQLKADMRLPGLRAPVTAYRDSAGIPHIQASSIEDAMLTQGFIVAQDRIFQLEMMRKIASGRMAEFFGSAALDLDKGTRALNFNNAATLLCSRLQQPELTYFQKYVDGINLYLERDGALSPEFMFMGPTYFTFYRPENFALHDLCLIARLMMFQLSGPAASYENFRWKLFGTAGFSYDDISELSPSQINASSILTPSQLGLSEADAVAARSRELLSLAREKVLYDSTMRRFRDNQTLGAKTAVDKATERAFSTQEEEETATKKVSGKSDGPSFKNSFFGFEFHLLKGLNVGSNTWAVRRGGQPAKVYGAGDPHLDANIPSVWHELVINIGDNFTAMGANVPGLPGIVYGRTNYLFWGITLSFGDQMDYYVMEPDPADPKNRYLYNGVSLAYSTRREVIKVKGSSSYTMTVQDSVLGPIVGEAMELTTRHKLAFNSTGVLQSGSPTPLWNVWLSRNVTAAVRSLQQLSAPTLSIVLGDSSGGIAWVCTGQHPIRRSGHTGKFPILGDGTYDYLGYVAPSELPVYIDTNINQDGWIAAANQKMYPDGYQYTLSMDYWSADRGNRIRSVMTSAMQNASSAILSFDFHKSLQLDDRSNAWADVYRPALVKLGSTWTSKLSPAGTTLWNKMLSWDNRSKYEATEPAYFLQWLAGMNRANQKLLDVLEWKTVSVNQRWALSMLTNPGPFTTQSCYDASSTGSRTCIDFAAEVWNSVATKRDYKWGTEFNRLNVKHSVFGGTFLSCLFNLDAPKDGDFSSVNYAGISAGDLNLNEYYCTDVPSMRNLYSFEYNYSLWALPAGNSAHPFSDNYDNLLMQYSRGGYTVVEANAAVYDGRIQQFSP